MKRFMLTVALTWALSVSVFAAEMPTAGVASSTPPPSVSAATAPAEMPSAGDGATEEPGALPGIVNILILTIITWR